MPSEVTLIKHTEKESKNEVEANPSEGEKEETLTAQTDKIIEKDEQDSENKRSSSSSSLSGDSSTTQQAGEQQRPAAPDTRKPQRDPHRQHGAVCLEAVNYCGRGAVVLL
eukprot:SAG31_NODE_11159_length_1059_cov_2.288542_2_plen_109_part_01